jgi:hypothetical protein
LTGLPEGGIQALLDVAYVVLGAALIVGFQELLKFLRLRPGQMDGRWLQEIAATKGRPARQDSVTCVHRGTHIEGTITRLSPVSERDRVWKFAGEVKDGIAFIGFEPTKGNDPDSRGTIQLRRRGLTLVGFYVRPVWAGEALELRQFPLKWTKQAESV